MHPQGQLPQGWGLLLLRFENFMRFFLCRFSVRGHFFLFAARCLVVFACGLFYFATFIAAVCCLFCALPARYLLCHVACRCVFFCCVGLSFGCSDLVRVSVCVLLRCRNEMSFIFVYDKKGRLKVCRDMIADLVCRGACNQPRHHCHHKSSPNQCNHSQFAPNLALCAGEPRVFTPFLSEG